MTVYVDSSVILRMLLGQPGHLREWRRIQYGVASVLVEVECLRTLDRLRLRRGIPEAEILVRREAVYRVMRSLELVDLSRAILTRAAQPLSTTLGTLDAIHLATAVLWGEHSGQLPVMATHDLALGTAARSLGFTVIGC